MKTQEQKLAAYNEAKEICILFIEYKGDKRRFSYKRLERMVFECGAPTVNYLGKQLGLPSFYELRVLFYEKTNTTQTKK